MTRINLVPPEELTDQHLFAEFREIKMVPKALRRSLIASAKRFETHEEFLARLPKEFTLNTGHVMFFYDKGDYLLQRYYKIRDELRKRGVGFNEMSQFDDDRVFLCLPDCFANNYTPTPAALSIIRQRLAEKIAMKPELYRYYGKPYTNADKSKPPPSKKHITHASARFGDLTPLFFISCFFSTIILPFR